VTTSTVENYVKQLYLEERASEGDMILMGRLATVMGVVPGTATAMVKTLSDSGLAEYQPRSGVRLTASGEQLALSVLRRHRLVELFLVKVLGLDWSEVHDEAEALEHAISDRVLERIDAFLGRPTADPHGDPIPTRQGRVHEPRRMSLADCPVDAAQKIVRVLDQIPEFLQYAERQGLVPGAKVTVIDREPASEAVRIRVARRGEVLLGLAAAGKILVEASAKL
jgi:DtxR family transcriptional regulator, Mn-dependent transcriptional regulator